MRTLLCFIALVVIGVCNNAEAQLILRKSWYESIVDSTSITYAWSTQRETECKLVITEPASGEAFEVVSNGSKTDFSESVIGLAPSTVYRVAIIAKASSETDTVSFYSSTASERYPISSITPYFNRSVDAYLPTTYQTNGSADYLEILHDRIVKANKSIDLALYSYSGFVTDSVTGWLKDALARSVRVRMITDSASTFQSNSVAKLKAAGVPMIYNSFGANGSTSRNIHHNKFMVFDADDPVNAYVIAGSWNLSAQQTTTDYQNILLVQDKSLAKAYTQEFNEEWGSDSEVPSPYTSMFSVSKSDNTPRTFRLGNTYIHLLFSPNGGISAELQEEIKEANNSILFGLFTLTQEELADALLTADQNGVDVHGIIDKGNEGNADKSLLIKGIDIVYGPKSTIFHHKYAILDWKKVVTGSYNWTYSAEAKNDENILIIDDSTIAKAYVNEWLTRYQENGGNVQKVLSTRSVKREVVTLHDLRLVENPTRQFVTLFWHQMGSVSERIRIVDQLGRIVFQKVVPFENSSLGEHKERVLLFPGIYFITVESGNDQSRAKAIVLP